MHANMARCDIIDSISFIFIFILGFLYFATANSATTRAPQLIRNSTSVNNSSPHVVDISSVTETLADPAGQAKAFEKAWKRAFRNGVKSLLPMLMNFTGRSGMSKKCMQDFTKYIGALTGAKLWAARMFDATSKPPAGLFEGTFSDFGAFDSCLDIIVPLRNGSTDFKGSYCAIEASPYMMPMPKNFSMSTINRHAGPHDTISKELLLSGGVFFYLKLRLGICIPSSCSVEDMRNTLSKVGEMMKFSISVPKCYVKEDTVSLSAIHVIVICILIVLSALCCAGTALAVRKQHSETKLNSVVESALLAFSLRCNYVKLLSESKSTGELRVLHGIRGLSIVWVILGHTYVWTNFQLLRRPTIIQLWFNQVEFGAILNAWLSVEPFFFLSGFLTCYGCIQLMEKTKGRINILYFIIRRYIRLMPSLLMVMGWIFFLPLISWGPFWYERVDTELESCRKYWWTSLLFISNWTSMRSICIHPTWFLSADFQLHILSLLVLFPLYRSSKLGLFMVGVMFSAATLTIAVLTYILELPPIIQITSGNNEQIVETVDKIHIRTFTHMGPYLIGMATGYLLLTYKNVKLSRKICCAGWCASITVSLASLYGAYAWNRGHPHGPLLTSTYACLHRSTFTAGVAWVAFACVTGHAGPVNRLLSSPVLAPLSRLTFCIYLTQSLVIWTRRASVRERMFYSHYNILYDFVGNLVLSIFLALPLHLLVEAPVSNIEKLLFTKRGAPSQKAKAEKVPKTKSASLNGFSNSLDIDLAFPTNTVELKSVKTVQDSNSDYAYNGSEGK